MNKTAYRWLVATSLLGATVASQITFPSVVEASDKGTFTVGNSVLNVRRSPSTSGEKVATYQPGDKINYDEIVVNDGYRWISYVGASGNRNYVAVGTADGSQSFGSLSGTASSSTTSSSSRKSSGKGTFTVGDSVLNVRRSPSASGEKVASYQPGDKINYDEIVVNDGYRWISYVGASGKRNYVAIGTADGSASYGSLSEDSGTKASPEITRIAGEWQSESGGIITIGKDGRITPSTLGAVVSWDGTKFIAPQVAQFDYNEATDVITYNEFGMGGTVVGYGMSEEEYKEKLRELQEGERKFKTYHRVGSKSEVITQSEEPKKGEEVVANQPTEAEKEVIAKVWNQLGAKQYDFYVYRRPAGTPVNYYDGVGENYPEVTYLLAEDVNKSGNSDAMSTEVLFSDNGDGTITLYKYIKKWHFSPDKFEEATKEHLADTEIVKLEDISSSEQEAMLQLVTEYEGFENSEEDSTSETKDSQADKKDKATETKTESSSQEATKSSSSDEKTSKTVSSSSSEEEKELTSESSTAKAETTDKTLAKSGNAVQRLYKTLSGKKTLPSTGESVSVLGLIGAGLLALAFIVKKKLSEKKEK